MEFNTNHRAVVATIALKPTQPSLRSQLPSSFNNHLLQDPAAIQQRYALEVSNRFAALSDDDRARWDKFKMELNNKALSTLGSSKTKKGVADTTDIGPCQIETSSLT